MEEEAGWEERWVKFQLDCDCPQAVPISRFQSGGRAFMLKWPALCC